MRRKRKKENTGDRVKVWDILLGTLVERGERVSQVQFDMGWSQYVPNSQIKPVVQRRVSRSTFSRS